MEPEQKTCDICFSFDTTGSMAPCLSEVRRNLQNIIPRLFRDIPNLRISLVAHGDYCDMNRTYLMKSVDFTDDQKALTEFVNTTGSTGGGDYPEAYEYVLNKVQEFNWQSRDTRCLVMIGDAYPHTAQQSPYHLNWHEEVTKLDKMGVNIYSVQCLNSGNRLSYDFYKTMAQKTNGYHLLLEQFSHVTNMILAVAYKQADPGALAAYQEEVAGDRLGGMDLNMRRMFDRLMGKKPKEGEEDDDKNFERKYDVEGAGDGDDLRPAPPAKFQILRVDVDCKITDFVRRMGLVFAKGKGFYEFTKPELIGPNKLIVLRRKATGELFQGKNARRLAKIPEDGASKTKPKDIPDYDVFVQSTSYTRKLIAGTNFLYEVPHVEA